MFRAEILKTEPIEGEPIGDEPVDIESEFTDCNCVVFRLDDVQDYWLADTQVKIIELSVDNFGFGVIALSLQEFSTVEKGVYVNSSNQEELDNLSSLISQIKNRGYEIVSINNIN